MKHHVTVHLTTDDNAKLNDIIRLVLGVKGIVGPEVEVDYRVHTFGVDVDSLQGVEGDEPF